MLISQYKLRGMSLVELLVAMVIIVILFSVAAPNFTQWIQNSRVRSTAEVLQNGLNQAKSEAVHRNAAAQFIPCGGSSWDILAASSVASAVAVACAADSANQTGWLRVQNRPTQPGDNSTVVSSQGVIAFNGLARQVTTTDSGGAATPTPPVAVDINVSTNLAGASCYCPAGNCFYPASITTGITGTLRCLRISVSPGGQIRMCDPALPNGSPQGC